MKRTKRTVSEHATKRVDALPRPVYGVAPTADDPTVKDALLDWSKDAPTYPPPTIEVGIQPPLHRPLKVYAIDSSRGKLPGNIITLMVKYEKLKPGPIGERICVVDYDGSRECFYDPVDLDDPLIAIQGGVEPSESDPHFHQQMVYAIASETLRRFESALGRTIRNRSTSGTTPLRMLIYPHARREANAFAQRNSLVFGYFRARASATGRIAPGQTVFTCLMHDVVVHTTTHAILNALRPDLLENGTGDSDAFLEGFCDLSAMLAHYSHRDALIDTIQRTGGLIYKSLLRTDGEIGAGVPQIQADLMPNNPFVALALGFGEATGMAGGLRTVLPDPDASALDKVREPHQRGQILLGAVFDAFFSIYVRRSQALFRIYRSGGGRSDSPDLPPPLAESLADEASRVATRVFNTCVRALDYCPTGCMYFGDYLRACITADYACDPTDKFGVRDSFMQGFRQRGITPKGASFFTEGALRWPKVDANPFKSLRPHFVGLPEPDASQQEQNQEALRDFIRVNASALSLRRNIPFDVYPLEAIRWTTLDDTPQLVLAAQVSQVTRSRKRSSLDNEAKGDESRSFAGVTLVFDSSGALRHAIRTS